MNPIAALQVVERDWLPRAVHDTVEVALRNPAFRRSLRRSLGERMLLWLGEWLQRLTAAIDHLPSLRIVGLTLVALIVLFVAVRAIVIGRLGGESLSFRARRKREVTADDPWRLADQLISQLRYEEAAHQLYRGVVIALGHSERLRLDPSRTSGDYIRELRRRGSRSLEPFRTFTRRFDRAVYGHERCDADAVETLRQLSAVFRPRAQAA